MSEEKAYRNRVMCIVLLGVIFWLIFGLLSQIGIFSFGIDFGFELIVRRVYAVLGLTILILSVILSIIMTFTYRQHFPKLNEQIEKGNKGYREMSSFRKIAFWVIMFGVLLQVFVFLLPFYIAVLTDSLVYEFELLETVIAVIFIAGVIMIFIPTKKVSDQKKELDRKKEEESKKQQKIVKGFSQMTLFKIMQYALYFMVAVSILGNFQGMLFTTDNTRIFFHLVLQIISVPLYVLFLQWVFKFRKIYFSMEPDKRKAKYKKMWIAVIIAYLLVIGLVVYEIVFEEIIENLYGLYSPIQFLYELSLYFGFLFLCFGVTIAILPKFRPD